MEFCTKGATHQKAFKLTNNIMSKKIIIGDFSIHQSTHVLKCKPKIKLENKNLHLPPCLK